MMTQEDIKKLVDDKRAEQLTAQLCRHWDIATQRLEALVEDMDANIDICVDAEIYAAAMRMQSSVMALMKLDKIPSAYLFSEYLDHIAKTVSNASMRQSVILLSKRLLTEQREKGKRHESFFEHVGKLIAKQSTQPHDKQVAVEPLLHVLAQCMHYLKPDEVIMIYSLIEEIKTDGNNDQEEVVNRVINMRQTMDDLSDKMSQNRLDLLICLFLLMILPEQLVNKMQQSRTDSKAMSLLFNKVLLSVRDSNAWWEYWKERRDTLKVVNDGLSLKQIMKAEKGKELEELGKVPGGLFAKWTTDRKAFEEDFLDARLDDDALRHFIFHLAALYEMTRELDPTTKFGEEQLVRNEMQQVGDAVLEAAEKLHDLTTEAWFPHYNNMWQELIQNETIFARLKVTRQSQHNDLYTARFFCHLVGEMKKSAVFAGHSDNDLAEKLTDECYKGTFRKHIQEGMGEEKEKIRNVFDAIFQKYNDLVHPKK